MAQPKWSTIDRKTALLKLWAQYGNRCLQGHTACPIKEHYTYTKSKVVLVPQAKQVECVNSSGQPIKDDKGNKVLLTVFPLRKVYTHTEKQARLYDRITEAVISDWQAEDRDADKAERLMLHNLAEPSYKDGRFGSISRDIFYGSQPLYYLEALGISGITLTPFAKVKLGSSYMRLYVDLKDSLKGISKNKRRKAIRYGKVLPMVISEQVGQTIRLAVRDYLK